MLFYADHVHRIDTSETTERVVDTLIRVGEIYRRPGGYSYPAALRTHADLVGAAIALGELHQAVADHLNPTVDDALPEADRLAVAGTLMGRSVYRSAALVENAGRTSHEDFVVRGSPHALLGLAAREAEEAAKPCLPLGSKLEVRIPEGYAFYSLYPEMYFASLARALWAQPGCRSYAVVGIRSIGTSLATMVAGALLEMGRAATVETVRPRGHPFDRYVEMTPALRSRMRQHASDGAGFILVDEGPGLTCSSFLSICSALEALGIDEERVVVLSAWQGAPSIYASDEARARWARLRVFHTDAAEAFQGWRRFVPFVRQALAGQNGFSLGDATDAAPPIHDLSYGRWRELLYPSQNRWPVVHRSTERTKVLYRGIGIRGSGAGGGILAKFAGLGEYGQRKHQRALALASAGFSPPVAGLAYGFLLHPFVADARPLEAADLSPALLTRMVEYYAFVARQFPAPPSPCFNHLVRIVLVNAKESLGLDAADFVAAWSPCRRTIESLPLTQVDGRPRPHEWLRVGNGDETIFLKTDSSDHFRDHTLVGEQSILWDLAGACEEWEMDGSQASRLLQLWEHHTGDRQAAQLLDFYRAAYLAFRVAALHYAVHSTNEEDIRRGLQHEEWKCRQGLRRALGCQPSAVS